MQNRFGRRSKKKNAFKPNRDYVESAVDDFLKKGGKITKIIADDESYQGFVSNKGIPEADDFLNG